jgi:hypothetical protein
MLRFLTDELQDAEDQGDRGMSFLIHCPRVSMKNLCHQFGFLVMFRVVGMLPIHLKCPQISVSSENYGTLQHTDCEMFILVYQM